MKFILDSSVSARWLLRDEKKKDQAYAEKVLAGFAEYEAWVPSLWWIDMADMLRKAEQSEIISPVESDQFVRLLAALPISERSAPGPELQKTLIGLNRQYDLKPNRASYLALAIREALPLATLDPELRRSASRAGIEVHLP